MPPEKLVRKRLAVEHVVGLGAVERAHAEAAADLDALGGGDREHRGAAASRRAWPWSDRPSRRARPRHHLDHAAHRVLARRAPLRSPSAMRAAAWASGQRTGFFSDLVPVAAHGLDVPHLHGAAHDPHADRAERELARARRPPRAPRSRVPTSARRRGGRARRTSPEVAVVGVAGPEHVAQRVVVLATARRCCAPASRSACRASRPRRRRRGSRPVGLPCAAS